jgi:hypothetical protein
MPEGILFAVAAAGAIRVSRYSFRVPRSEGFYGLFFVGTFCPYYSGSTFESGWIGHFRRIKLSPGYFC